MNPINHNTDNIPELRFPDFKNDWEVKKFEEVFNIFNGYAFSSSDAIENGILWVKIADVGIQEMKKDSLSFLPKKYENTHQKFILKKGDYVVALTRPILNGKLKIAQVDDFFNNSLLNQRVGKIITHNCPPFIYSLLQKDELIKAIENNIAGSDPPNLSPSEINFISVSIPTLPEQQKIANFLTAVDEKLSHLKKKKSLLEQYKKGVMQKIFSQEIRFKPALSGVEGDENGLEFPEWEEKKIGEVTNYVDYRGRAPIKTEEGYFLVTAKNIKKGFIDYECSKEYVSENNYSNVMSKGLPEVGDVLFTTEAPMGNVAQVDKANIALAQRVIKFRSKEMLSNLYLLNYMLSDTFQKLISEKSIGTTVQGISGKELHKIKLSLPSLSEQTKIANFLSAIDEKINHFSKHIEKTEQWKKGLLQKMFV